MLVVIGETQFFFAFGLLLYARQGNLDMLDQGDRGFARLLQQFRCQARSFPPGTMANKI